MYPLHLSLEVLPSDIPAPDEFRNHCSSLAELSTLSPTATNGWPSFGNHSNVIIPSKMSGGPFLDNVLVAEDAFKPIPLFSVPDAHNASSIPSLSSQYLNPTSCLNYDLGASRTEAYLRDNWLLENAFHSSSPSPAMGVFPAEYSHVPWLPSENATAAPRLVLLCKTEKIGS
ncbi:hypothetical protein APHAL10511_000387 [Amanita phalloides]|nr:hypothetical protein APHAL10511_000387 [Amanita phalloides]